MEEKQMTRQSDMTEKLFYEDGYRKEFTARVLSCEKEKNGGGYRVALDRTAFFPEGGGQFGDIGWLGRMLFSGEEALKEAKVLSGGEKVRCMLAKMMLEGGNFLILDEPTNHLDLESITSLNNGLVAFKGCMLLTSHDQELMNTACNRIIVVNGTKVFDKNVTFDEYAELTNA